MCVCVCVCGDVDVDVRVGGCERTDESSVPEYVLLMFKYLLPAVAGRSLHTQSKKQRKQRK